MPTMIMKCISIAALITAVSWRGSADYRVVLSFVMTVSAIAAIAQASRAGKKFWIILFVTVITVFNPGITGALPPHIYFWTDLTCLAAFVSSLVLLKDKPVLSIASITDRPPGSESL